MQQLTKGVKRLGVEMDHISADYRKQIEDALPGVELVGYDVFGNIHSSNCGPAAPSSSSSNGGPPAAALPAVNPAGEIVLECARDKGEIYIRPVGDSPKPVNLFISSAHATYTLVLRKADTPADTIVIREPQHA